MSIVEKRLATILSRNWWVLLVRGLIAIYAVVFGVLLVLLSFRVKGLANRVLAA